jgi:SAM-dependent methyltransferase
MFDMPRMYEDLAGWWPLLSPPEDYAEEASFYWNALVAASSTPPRTLLELGSGGGNNASHLKTRVDLMVLVEPAEGMRALSTRLNPECEHVAGDMRSVRLGRAFDAVFVHDAVSYMTTERDLRQAMETAYTHCAPGGVVLFAPDYVRENFAASTECGGSDNATHGLRYMEWAYDPDPADTEYVVDYAYLLRFPDGHTRVEHDRHIEALFGRESWLKWLREAGFDASAVPFVHSEIEPGAHELFVGARRR